jgi:glyoxylase-like metal-dependent hydrolase (beta-lactamase superfamily II)
MENSKLYVLNGGFINVERGFTTHFGTHLDRGKPYTPGYISNSCTQYFINHPQAKIVVDLGYLPEDYEPRVGFPIRADENGIRFKQEKDQNPKAQLEKIGVSLDDIDCVILSHLHLEHIGYLPLFDGKKAKIIVQRKELEFAYSNVVNRKFSPEPFQSWMYFRQHFDRPGLNYMPIEGDYTLVNGVEILFTPGHTPGYQMVRVDLKKEGMIILSPCEIELMYSGIGINAEAPGIPHPFSYSLADELFNFRKITALARKENGQIFCGHDRAQLNKLKKIPEFYE